MLSSHCESMLAYAAAAGRRPGVLAGHRRYRPNVEVAPNCPRCDSPNTKFCYYNNYSLSQPRYFCKGCRRYWTKGGSLRNVPVGGGCRKNRRGKAVRAMVVDTAADAATSGAAPFSHRFHGPVRPDMLLEGTVAVGNPSSLDQPAVPDDKPPALHGSTIDLALLYAKFLNHNQPLAEQCAAVPESIDNSSGSSDYHMSPGAPAAATTGHVQDGLAEPSTELNFSVDQSCYDSLGLATDGADLILPATWDQDARYDPFGSLPEDAISLHDHDVITGGDDFWSNALGCQGLEAAVCRP